MTQLHYFPRYSQKENMVTNNTMLLFRRVYANSPKRFNDFMNSVIQQFNNDSIEMNISFDLQVKGVKSVPDAAIRQEYFQVLIETKLNSKINFDQIKRHVEGLVNQEKENQGLLLITPSSLMNAEQQRIDTIMKESNDRLKDFRNRIFFSHLTFKEIPAMLRVLYPEHDYEMRELIDDFEGFCYYEHLIPKTETKVRFVPTGTTYEQNRLFNLYYDPSRNGYTPHQYIGLYTRKAVRAIGKINCVVDVEYDAQTGNLKTTHVEFSQITDSQLKTLEEAIIAARKYNYGLEKGHRFFFVDEFIDANYVKKSYGGMVGKQFFDAETLLQNPSQQCSAAFIASELSRMVW
jgi:hypothetical protein